MIYNVKYFIENCDFDMLWDWLENADPVTVLLNPYVLVTIIALVGLISYHRTSYLGQQLVLYVPAVGYLFVTVVILRDIIAKRLRSFNFT